MKTYGISIRDKSSRALFRGEKSAECAVVACNLALLEVAQQHGDKPCSHLSLWCEERAPTTKESTSGEALHLR